MNASDCYEQLMQLCPEVESYKMYYAQALYHACMYPEAMKATFQVESPECQPKVRWKRVFSHNMCGVLLQHSLSFIYFLSIFGLLMPFAVFFPINIPSHI